MKVADAIIEQLFEWGVKHIFGIPGHTCLGLVEAIRSHGKVDFVRVRHEEGASLMASAYAKLTGNIGTCLTIAGPGATNLMTGLYDAKMDRAPVLALTGQVKLQYIGPGSFQEIDQQALFESVSVFNETIVSEEQTVELVILALRHSLIERGVSHLSIPNDVQTKVFNGKILPRDGFLPNMRVVPPEEELRKAIELINSSEKITIIAGWGCIAGREKLLEFAEKIQAPVATTFRAKGLIPEMHPLSIGVLGNVGSGYARKIVNKSDLLIVLGSSFSDMTNIPDKPIIHIDIDPIQIGRRRGASVGLWGDCTSTLPYLIEGVNERKSNGMVDEIRKKKKEWFERLDREADSNKIPVRPPYIMKTLTELVEEDAIITTDVGENGWWLGRNFIATNQKILLSGYLATMGFGLPAAIASKLAMPDKQVVCVTGDGGFSQIMGEFMTAVERELPITVVLMNNHALGMIAVEQKMERYPNFATKLKNADFAEFAESSGGAGYHVKRPEDLEDALNSAMKEKVPSLVDIDTDPKRF
jgi:thiamine pyrophosphate-dependent acetolactate synthase large subunit-like protein